MYLSIVSRSYKSFPSELGGVLLSESDVGLESFQTDQSWLHLITSSLTTKTYGPKKIWSTVVS